MGFIVLALLALLVFLPGCPAASEVDPASGALRESVTDHVLPTPLSPLKITRSHAPEFRGGPLGPGWRLDIASRLEWPGNDEARLHHAIGIRVFRRQGGEDYLGPDGQRISRLAQSSMLSSAEGGVVHFDAQGNELLRRDAHGNEVAFVHDAQGRLVRVTAGQRSELRLSYGAAGRLLGLEDAAGRRVAYAFDGGGRLARVTGADGRTTTYRYDDRGRLSGIGHPDGTGETFAYDDAGRIAQRRDAAGVTERYRYQGNTTRVSRGAEAAWEQGHDAAGRPLWRQDGQGRRETWTWNDEGRLVARAYADGSRVNLAYDPRGRLAAQESSSGGRLRFAYDERSGRLQSLERDGAVTRFEHDARGNLASVVSPSGRVTRFEYDSLGRPVASIDDAGRRTRLAFDDQGRLVRREEPDGAATQWDFDAAGRLLRRVDALGQAATFSYQADGLLASAAVPGLPAARFAYDAQGRLVAEFRGGRRVEYGYDPAGRINRVRHGDGTQERYAYGADGRLVEEVDRLGNVTRSSHGADGTLAQVDLPSGLQVRYRRPAPGHVRMSLGGATMDIRREAGGRLLRLQEGSLGPQLLALDGQGRLLRSVSPQGHEERRQYDADGLLTEVALPGGDRWQFAYEGSGLLAELRFPDGPARRLEYDANGRLAALHLPWGGKVQYRYDGLGRVTERINARGQSVRFAYDAAGRLVEKQTPDETWRYRYDADGELLETSNGESTQRSTRDAHGRLVGLEHLPGGQKLTWRRDALGRVVERSGPAGLAVRYRYDKLGRPAAQEAGPALRLELAYDARGRLASTRSAAGTVATYAYDEADRLIDIVLATRSGARLARHYGYDGDGNRTSVAGADAARTLRYDADGQLVSESGSGMAAAYRYGAGGQRLAVTAADGDRRYRYDAGGRLVQAGSVRYAYDADGNRSTRSDARGTTRYAYDAEGRLSTVTLPDGRRVRYGYGPWGERLWREADGVRSYFVYDGEDLVAELDAAFRLRAGYFHTAADRPWALVRPEGARFYHLDAQGSVIALSDGEGRLRTRYRQDAFGADRRAHGEPDDQPLGYAGRPRDPDTGLVDMRARFYDPEVGAFISPDPVLGTPDDPASLILYAYARNNPHRHADTSGLASNGYDPFPEALRGNPPPPPPGYWPGHTATWDFDNYRHGIAEGVYRNVRDQARQAERAAEQQAMQQRQAHPEPGYDNRTVQQTPGRQAINYVRRQAGSLGERIGAGAQAAGERAGAALNRAGAALQAGAQRLETAAQPYVGGAQRLSSVTGRGYLAIRMADIAGEVLAADDPTQVPSDRAVDFAGYAATSAALGQATSWVATAAPAVVTVGGAAVGTVALTTASLERVAAAAEQRGEQWVAEQRADWAEQRAADTSRDITQDRQRHLDALHGKAAELRRLRALLASQASEATALELEAANQRNAAQAKAGQVQDLRGRIRAHEAVIAAARGGAAGVDLEKLRTMAAAIEALAEQACAEGGGDRAALAQRAASQAAALDSAASPAGQAEAIARVEAEAAVADGYATEAAELQSALQGTRRGIQERLGMIQGLAAGYTTALAQARHLQAAVKGSANALRLFLQGDDAGTLGVIAQEADAGLPAEGALAEAVQGAQESLGGVDVEAMLGGIVADAQSHAGTVALQLAALQADQGAAQGIAARGRNAADRGRECAGRTPAAASPPGEPDQAADTPARECTSDQDCAIGYACTPQGTCIRDPRYEAAAGEGAGVTPGTQPACAGDGDCRQGQRCRQGRCVDRASDTGVGAVLDLFGQRAQQRDQERGPRDSGLPLYPGAGERYGAEGLRDDMRLLQESAAGQGTGPRTTGATGPTVGPPTTPGRPPATGPGTQVPGQPGQPARPPTTPPPTAGGAGQLQYYLIEAVVAYDRRVVETGVGWRDMSCTITSYVESPVRSAAELETNRRRWGESVLGLVRGTSGALNPRLVSCRVVAGPSATVIRPPVSAGHRIDCH